MQTVIIEALSTGGNWGKFLVGRMTNEWEHRSTVSAERLGWVEPGSEEASRALPVMIYTGWSHDHVVVLDLQTGEGARFKPGGLASADLNKHKIWVCPLFEPFLAWLYRQDLRDLTALPPNVMLDHQLELYGRRRGQVPPA